MSVSHDLKVKKIEDVKRGLERLGLIAEIGNTKAPNWKRIHIHVPNYRVDYNGEKITLYIGRISFENGIINSYKFFGLPSFWAFAINLLLREGKIANHINYYSLGVKAYNATVHLKEEADKLKGKSHSKALKTFFYEKTKLFNQLINEAYYGCQTPSS